MIGYPCTDEDTLFVLSVCMLVDYANYLHFWHTFGINCFK